MITKIIWRGLPLFLEASNIIDRIVLISNVFTISSKLLHTGIAKFLQYGIRYAFWLGDVGILNYYWPICNYILFNCILKNWITISVIMFYSTCHMLNKYNTSIEFQPMLSKYKSETLHLKVTRTFIERPAA